MPQALAALHEAVRAGNSALAGQDLDAAAARLAEVEAMTAVLGLDDVPEGDDAAAGPVSDALDSLVRSQIEARAQARADKDWATADRIRDALAAAGVVVEDGADGATWRLAD